MVFNRAMNTPKSETPEVDALLDEHGKLLSNTLKYPTEQALIWLSRKLERERDALLKEKEDFRKQLEPWAKHAVYFSTLIKDAIASIEVKDK